MKRLLVKSLALTASLLLTGHLMADNGKPDLWKVEQNGNASYIFGSIHLGSEDMYPLSKAVKGAYNNTNTLVVEIDLKPGDEVKMVPLVQKYGLDLAVPLEKRLSTKTLAIYKKVCMEKSLPCEQFAPFKAWLLSAQLSVMSMQQLGYKEGLGIDKHFLALAHQSKKDVISLETAESQFQVLGGFNQQQQEMMLVESLQAKKEDFVGLFNAWKTGDDKSLISMFLKDIDRPGAREMYNALFDDRNFKMVAKIAKNISANKSLFVVVGAGHVVGKNGLVDLLTKKGFKLTQIQ